MEDLIKAGKIAAEAREFGKTLCKPGAKIFEIADKIEEKIRKLGGKPAFPTDVSLNSMAAHYCPIPNDPITLKEGDLVKLDLGCHINGKVTDTACTIEVSSSKNKKLIEASEEALKKAIEIAVEGTELREIGKVIEKTIKDFGFNSIKNLSGHGTGDFEIHTWPTVPNYGNEDKTKLEKDMIIAIEPFATTGIGLVKEGKPATVYSLIQKKPVRDSNARKVLEFIEKEYSTLPFCTRWLTNFQNINYVLRILEQAEIIKQYTTLPEKSNGLVSQAEKTVLVGKGCIT